MWEQEKEHLKAFEKLLVQYRTGPTVLLPLWDVVGKFILYKLYSMWRALTVDRYIDYQSHILMKYWPNYSLYGRILVFPCFDIDS